MARYVVNVPEYLSRKKFTAGQFIQEFAETGGGRSKLPLLPKPVTVQFVDSGDVPYRETFREAAPLFALFQRVALCRGVVFRLSWKGCTIGPAGLYELNRAIREPAVRKGGLNIVRHWLENHGTCLTPFGSDLAALFDFLEIRPLFTRERQAKALSPTSKTLVASASAALPLCVMSIIPMQRLSRTVLFTTLPGTQRRKRLGKRTLGIT